MNGRKHKPEQTIAWLLDLKVKREIKVTTYNNTIKEVIESK